MPTTPTGCARRACVRSAVDGLPVSVKDLFDVAGDVTRAGSKLLAGAAPAAADAPAVARLRAAGAVIVGRTNMVEFAFGATASIRTTARRRIRGTGKTGRVPGGSSSGAAVAQADGMCVMALGTRHARLDPPARGAVRRRRLQADAAARAARGRVPAFLHARFDRPAREHRGLLRRLRRDPRRRADAALPTLAAKGLRLLVPRSVR